MRVKSADRRKALARRWVAAWTVLAPATRSGLLLAVVCLIFSVLHLRTVYADVTEVLWGIGARAMEYPSARTEGIRQLQLNGIRVFFRTQTVNAPLANVLSHYEALCGARDAGLADQLSKVLDARGGFSSTKSLFRGIATHTARDDNAGYVACLDMGATRNDLVALANRFLRFSQTGDLAEVGAPRYAFARRVESRLGDRTFLLTMWADSSIDLYQVLPRVGVDAAGHDLFGMPRPPDSQRILSASEAQRPNGVFVYRVFSKSAEALASFYRRELTRNGWTIIESNAAESVAVDRIHMLTAEKNNRLVTVLSHTGDASQTVLTILASEP